MLLEHGIRFDRLYFDAQLPHYKQLILNGVGYAEINRIFVTCWYDTETDLEDVKIFCRLNHITYQGA